MSAPSAPGFDPEALRAALGRYPQRANSVAGMGGYVDCFGLETDPGVEHLCGFVDAAGHRVFCQRFVPPAPRGRLLLVHGLFDHGGICWRNQLRWALDRSIAVLLFDLPGHGLTSGDPTHVDDFEDYVDVLETVLPVLSDGLPGPLLAAGHSTGCSVLLHACLDASRGGFEPHDLLLFAPLVRPGRDRLLRMAVPMVSAFSRALPRTPEGNTSDPEFNALRAQGDPLQPRSLSLAWLRAMLRWSARFDAFGASDRPALVIQGTQDAVVDWRPNLRRIAARLPALREALIDGAGHGVQNEPSPRREQIHALLDERLATLLGS